MKNLKSLIATLSLIVAFASGIATGQVASAHGMRTIWSGNVNGYSRAITVPHTFWTSYQCSRGKNGTLIVATPAMMLERRTMICDGTPHTEVWQDIQSSKIMFYTSEMAHITINAQN